LAGVIIDERSTPYSYLINDGTLSALWGTIESRVVRSSLDGTVDFYWRIVPTANPFGGAVPNGIIRSFITYAPAIGEATPNVDWRTDLPDGIVPPEQVRRFGNQYEYRFPLGVGVGLPSRWFFLDTQLPTYFFTDGRINMLDESGNSTPFYPGFQPLIPEPATVSLFLVGAGIILLRRQRGTRGSKIRS
jgi:hypothetical protein